LGTRPLNVTSKASARRKALKSFWLTVVLGGSGLTGVVRARTGGRSADGGVQRVAAGCDCGVGQPQVADYAFLRGSPSSQARVYITERRRGLTGASGYFFRDDSDTVSPDNDGTILVAKNGQRWKREYTGDIYARWFGATGDGVTDDTDATNKAISFAGSVYRRTGVAQRVVFDNGVYRIATASGTIPIPSRDDGTVERPHGRTLDPEPVVHQPFCVAMQSGVKLVGVNAAVCGAYSFGDPLDKQPITFAFREEGPIYDCGIESLNFKNCFIAYAAMWGGLATCIFEKIRFSGCGIGIYASILEQCIFSNLEAQGTAVLVLVGGQWVSRNDGFNERGGYADKCTFINLRNIFNRIYGPAELDIDRWFDSRFFKTVNNESRLGTPTGQASQAKTYRYRGICGFAVRVMARYARPSNSNVFIQITHAMSPRPAVLVDGCTSAVFSSVYLEGVGYRDNRNRRQAVGVAWDDPYLGKGIRVPSFIGDLDSTSSVSAINIQFGYGVSVVQSDGPIPPIRIFESTLAESAREIGGRRNVE
jgi:hypothetical protein